MDIDMDSCILVLRPRTREPPEAIAMARTRHIRRSSL